MVIEHFEFRRHSFIVKVWLEDADRQHGPAEWRGHITHVPSGARRYVRELKQISAFIGTYLKEMGARVDTGSRVAQWLKGLRRGAAEKE